MALKLDGQGSGKFVPATEWSCSQHKYPQSHDCDCDRCDSSWDCDECSTSAYVPVMNEDGSPKMRELSVFEVFLSQGYANAVTRRFRLG